MNFRQIILDFPKQFQTNIEFHNQLLLTRREFDKVLICGMGGSALIGDIFYYFKQQKYLPLSLGMPIFTHRSYNLPPDIDEHTLVICISYSGNTEETISAYKTAIKKSLAIAGITCGGELKKLFEENQTPWVEIPNQHIQPRMSLGYQLAALTKIFIAYGLIPQSAQIETEKATNKIKPNELEKSAHDMAEKIGDRMPIIYASEENRAIIRLWKIKFNENAKIPAFFNNFPELNHNEMNGWIKNANQFYFLFLSDENDLPRIQKRFGITKSIIEDLGGQVENLKIQGNNPLEKILWAMIFSDWLSCHLSMKHNIDPLPVELIEKFKKAMEA